MQTADRPLPPSPTKLRQVLEVTALVFVSLASLAVIALCAWVWQERRQVHVAAISSAQNLSRAPRPSIPTEPQPLDGPMLGSKTAKAAIIEYSDFECPFCRQFFRDTWPLIKTRYVEPGRVLTVFKHLPLPMHTFAMSAASDADCAGEQNHFWEMHELLFAQLELSDATRHSLPRTLRLDASVFEGCLQRQPSARIKRDTASARALGINSTPTFVIGRVQSGDSVKVEQVLVGAQPYERFQAVLDNILQAN